ncbi:putative large secreted protein [[Actinomadura] parvosata subsp. kistnae]|uniref:hypothetical protein n=1 Tax=[Actinomadura] parvosata TaxID=1955412 RepID=UPI000D26189B|nr:hypothetical protein [Nonomuraea sp. ATCC 55076]SPL96852.1 putative large secreted protein [Actinomadura parvosata subsp. kistnae]
MNLTRKRSLALSAIVIPIFTLISPSVPAHADVGSAIAPESWALVTSKHPHRAHYVPYEPTWDGDDDAVVGRTNQPKNITRAFFQVKVSSLAAKRVFRADLALGIRDGSDCDTQIEVWETTAIGPRTTWKRQPRWLRKLSTTTPELTCPSVIGISHSVTQAVQDAAARGDEYLTIGLRSADESVAGRRLYRTTSVRENSGPALITRYNTAPDVPSELSVRNGCQGAAAGPDVGTSTPSLRATATDPDTETNAEVLRVRFEWADASGAKLGESVSAETSSPSPHCVTVPAGQLTDGGRYTWRARTENAYRTENPDGTGWLEGWDHSAWTPWQPEFTVDTTKPGQPLISSADFPQGQVGGRVGLPGTFTLSPNGSPDVASYSYSFSTGQTGKVAVSADGSAVLTYTPTLTFPATLTVSSVDRAGNQGPATTYTFRAAPAAPPTVSSAVYPPDVPGGGVGVPGEFVFGVNGVDDATTFRYRLESSPEQNVAVGADGTATVTITPTRAGANRLTVTTLNAAGVRLGTKTYTFTVGAA